MESLQGQNVVVVGGSRGIGRAIAEVALSEGATVLAVARGSASLKRLSIEAQGVRTLALDATSDTAPGEVFEVIDPDVLVICAGAFPPSVPIQEQSWQVFSTNWETDVRASFLFCKAALQGPLKPGTRVILISSGAALSAGPPTAGGYGAAKRLQMFMAGHCQKESDRLKLGLRFIALAPARIMTETELGKTGLEGIAAYMGMKPADLLAGMTDKQTPADVGRAVVALANGKHQGISFVVSGGGLTAAD